MSDLGPNLVINKMISRVFIHKRKDYWYMFTKSIDDINIDVVKCC